MEDEVKIKETENSNPSLIEKLKLLLILVFYLFKK